MSSQVSYTAPSRVLTGVGLGGDDEDRMIVERVLHHATTTGLGLGFGFGYYRGSWFNEVVSVLPHPCLSEI